MCLGGKLVKELLRFVVCVVESWASTFVIVFSTLSIYNIIRMPIIHNLKHWHPTFHQSYHH